MEYQTTLSPHEPIAITIGNFDGIHLGHQRLLHEVGELARTLQCKSVLVTFWPHTLLVVRPDIDIRYLTTQDEKLALAKQYGGIADSIVITFTPEVAAMSAEDFINHLCQRFSIQGMVVGADFSLGRNRMGDINFLKHYGEQHNIRLHTISLAEAHQNRISSSRIRTLLSQGDIAQANELLGHPVIVSGIVRQGAKRGRMLGFPTANLHPDARKLYQLMASMQLLCMYKVTKNVTHWHYLAYIKMGPILAQVEEVWETLSRLKWKCIKVWLILAHGPRLMRKNIW